MVSIMRDAGNGGRVNKIFSVRKGRGRGKARRHRIVPIEYNIGV